MTVCRDEDITQACYRVEVKFDLTDIPDVLANATEAVLAFEGVPTQKYSWHNPYGYGGIAVPVYLNDTLIGTVDAGRFWNNPAITLTFNPQDYLSESIWIFRLGWKTIREMADAIEYNITNKNPAAWAEGVDYAAEVSCVTKDDVVYACISSHTSAPVNSPPNSTYWIEAPQGLKIPDYLEYEGTNYEAFVWSMPNFKGLFFKPVYEYGDYVPV